MGQAQEKHAAERPMAGETTSFWVVGGIYEDTGFDQIADSDRREERFGPFESYKDAYAEWARLAWRSVDDCHARYRIVARREDAA